MSGSEAKPHSNLAAEPAFELLGLHTMLVAFLASNGAAGSANQLSCLETFLDSLSRVRESRQADLEPAKVGGTAFGTLEISQLLQSQGDLLLLSRILREVLV